MRRTKEEAMQTRDAVLKAAAQIIARQGVGAFTIDAVAQEAGVTKGGVLHHFRSKEELISGLIDSVMQMFSARLMEEIQTEPENQPGRWLRAYIRTVFSVQYEVQNLIPALAAAVAADQQQLNRIRLRFAASQDAAIEDGLDPIQATLIRLAVDGIVFSRALGVDVLDKETSQRVYDELFRLTNTVTSQA